MKNNFRFLLTLAMTFSMFVATLSLSTRVDASELMLDSEGNVISNAEIEAVAAQLEFVHDEASIYDDNGTFLGFDIDKIEAEYGSDLGVSHLQAPAPGELYFYHIQRNRGVA
ncbi:hypothetical protein ACFPYN_09720 [Paenisporosarcina macmurdoensis]|uniref:Uncharacterized protein n=1 Tax=Paenisporosarcina macmurdoensis TaxID=212659 RepID=A0ABW1L6U6_9BACL